MDKLIELAVLILLAIVLFTLVDPFMYWMPSMTQMFALTFSAVLLALLAGFIVAEKGGDERELQHRMYAGRAAFLSGIAVLTIALTYQGFTHSIDAWVPLALFAMVCAKLFARAYGERVN